MLDPEKPSRSSTNGYAVASLFMGIFPVLGIGPVLAIVFGRKARRQIDGSAGAETGRRMATAGIVLGWVNIGIYLTVGLVFAFDVLGDESVAWILVPVVLGLAWLTLVTVNFLKGRYVEALVGFFAPVMPIVGCVGLEFAAGVPDAPGYLCLLGLPLGLIVGLLMLVVAAVGAFRPAKAGSFVWARQQTH